VVPPERAIERGGGRAGTYPDVLLSAAARSRHSLAADVSDYELAAGLTATICDVPPVFRVRLSCPSPADAADLLAFLRRDGVFAYPVGGAIEAVAAESQRLDAPRELIARVVDWLERTDAALAISLS
jgi:hypothetical protein